MSRESYEVRNRRMLALGYHPRTGERLRTDVTCSKCRFLLSTGGNGRRDWYKCGKAWGNTDTPTTDCHPRWPGCTKFQPREKKAGNALG